MACGTSGTTPVSIAEDPTYQAFYEHYADYHIPQLNYRRIKRKDIEPFINDLKSNPLFEVTELGQSVQGRTINLVKMGTGEKTALLWSQMHGDESTATRALFEIFRFFASNDSLNAIRKEILDHMTIYCIPMLNPDGAEAFTRRTALNIDMNRDALRLISPEARILKDTRDRFQPMFGFNLHDQSKYYNAYQTNKTASVSFLAPAFNYDKDVNEGRGNAMKLIVSMDKAIQHYLPGQVGRYDDAFEPRAFGDNIQKWGTNTILIESGGNIGDPEKMELVKMNFMIILHAMLQIVREDYQNYPINAYYAIPENDRKFFDILIRNAQVPHGDQLYIQDIGINANELAENDSTLFFTHKIEDLGDLSTFYGYEEVDGSGLVVSTGQVLSEPLTDLTAITPEKAMDWLKKGITTVRLQKMPGEVMELAKLPIAVAVDESPDSEIDIELQAPLLMSKDGIPVYAVINGQLITIK